MCLVNASSGRTVNTPEGDMAGDDASGAIDLCSQRAALW